jgi:hypothetical protein
MLTPCAIPALVHVMAVAVLITVARLVRRLDDLGIGEAVKPVLYPRCP